MAASDKQVKIVITGENKSDKAFKEVEGQASRLGGLFKKSALAVAAFGAAGVAAAGAFAYSSIKAFAEAEASAAKVNAILETLPKNLKLNRQEFDKVANSALKLGFSNETAAETLAMFMQRTNDLTKAQKLNALAMDLARAKNIDLSQAATLVNQVLSGQGKILKQYGIEIDDTLPPLEALAQLQEKVKGQASAFSDTIQGKLAILSESWGEVRESIGKLLAEALEPFLDKLIVFVQRLQEVDFSVEAMKQRFADFVNQVKEVIQFIDTQTGLITALKEAWEGIVFVFENSLLPSFQKLWEEHGPLLTELGKSLAVVFGTGLVIALKLVIDALTLLSITIVGVLDFATQLVNFISDIWVKAIDFLAERWQKLADIVQSVIDAMKSAINFGGKIGGKIGSALSFGSVNDAIISGGKIITTNPSDYIVSRDPRAAMSGGGPIVNINYPTLFDEGMVLRLGEEITRILRRDLRY